MSLGRWIRHCDDAADAPAPIDLYKGSLAHKAGWENEHERESPGQLGQSPPPEPSFGNAVPDLTAT